MFSKDKIIKKKWEDKMKNQRIKFIHTIKKCINKNRSYKKGHILNTES